MNDRIKFYALCLGGFILAPVVGAAIGFAAGASFQLATLKAAWRYKVAK